MPTAIRRSLLMGCWLVCLTSVVWGEERPQGPYPKRTSGAASLRYEQGYPVMFLSGTPEEMGRQQGELVGDVINPMLGIPRRVAAEHGYHQLWPVVAAMSRVLVHNAPEQYQRELEAFITAGKLDRDGIFVGNSLVELRRMGGCSAFLVQPHRSATGGLLFGRNFDFPAFGVLDRYHCIFVVKPEGKHAFVSIGYPGMIGVISGMNDAGLAIATLDVYQSADGSPLFDSTGVPLALTYRRILEECTTTAEAEQLLKSVPRTTYMNLAAADRERAVVFEITPQTVGVREADHDLVGCTNHFQLPGLSEQRDCPRIVKLDRLSRRADPFGLKDVQQALNSVNQGSMTIQTMIFEPDRLGLHLVMGPGPVSGQHLKVMPSAKWLNHAQPPVAAEKAPLQ
ncbi:MAG: C45 family autoproteolytic acyltransferase/hydrolase [Planctomycetaceae bacterium]